MKNIDSYKTKIIILLLFLICFSGNLYSNGPTSPVQGLCRITKNDNSVIEGIILISSCGFLRVCETNGFIVYSEKEVKPKLFNYDFEEIKIFVKDNKKRVSFKYLSEHESIYSLDKFDVYFVEDITSKFHYLSNFEFEFVEDSSINKDYDKVLRRKYFTEYRLLDYIPIMPKMTKDGFITYTKLRDQFLKIPLKDIARIELLRDPSEDWLLKIEEAEKNMLPDAEGDIRHPIWYHELINRSRRDERFFKKWPY